MNKTYNSKAMKVAAYGSIVLILLEVIRSFTSSINIIHTVYAFVFIAIIAPICFILLLLSTRKIQRDTMPKSTYVLTILKYTLLDIFLATTLAMISINTFPDVPGNEVVSFANANLIFTVVLILWQLLGEEAIKISLFFLIYKGFDYSEERKKDFWLAWLFSSIFFGLMHLSTYGYNYFHCILVIGLPTLLFGLLWKKTSRPSMLYLVHVTYDVILIAIALIAM